MGYYPPGELERWADEEHDPVKRFRKESVQRGLLTVEQIEEIERESDKKIEEAIEFAQNSPWIRPEDIMKFVHVK